MNKIKEKIRLLPKVGQIVAKLLICALIVLACCILSTLISYCPILKIIFFAIMLIVAAAMLWTNVDNWVNDNK